jgi:hypothetical protein
MKNFILIFLLLICSSASFSQTINGRLVEFEANSNPFDSSLFVMLKIKLNDNENAVLGHAHNVKFNFNSLAVEFIEGVYVNFNESNGYTTFPMYTITNPGNSKTIQNIETLLTSGAGIEITDEYIDFVLFVFKITDFSQSVLLCPHNNSNGFHFKSLNSTQDWIIGEWFCYEPNVPVELTSFTANSKARDVILNWSTATELNNQGFEIERKQINNDWLKIGFISGNGTTVEEQRYVYSDKNLHEGKYYYRLKQLDYDGNFEYSNVIETELYASNSYSLEQNYPNPFNPITKIRFVLQNKSNVKLTVLNLIGEELEVLLDGEKGVGIHQVEFNASQLISGVYFYRIQAGDFVETKKMILLK